APLTIGGKNHLGISVRAKGVSETFQFLAKFQVVIYFAVVTKPVSTLKRHRLLAGIAEVQNGQTAVTKCHLPCRRRRGAFGNGAGLISQKYSSLTIGTPMTNQFIHSRDFATQSRRVRSNDQGA